MGRITNELPQDLSGFQVIERVLNPSFRDLLTCFSEIYWRVGCFTATTHPIPLHVPNSFTWDGGDLLHQCHDPSKALIDVKRSVAADAVVLIIS